MLDGGLVGSLPSVSQLWSQSGDDCLHLICQVMLINYLIFILKPSLNIFYFFPFLLSLQVNL